MITLKFSEDSDYHTQRNNELVPHRSCGVTSVTMALKQAGIEPIRLGAYPQPEDDLLHYMNTAHIVEKMHELCPWAFDRDGAILYPPNEVHVMIEWTLNMLYGVGTDTFSMEWSIKSLVRALLEGAGVVMSGEFPVGNGTLSHVVSVSGLSSMASSKSEILNEPEYNLNGFFIDDPYGDFRTEYRDHHGNDVWMPLTEFYTIMKNQSFAGRKWAHIIRKV